jgi:DNA repair photolyase
MYCYVPQILGKFSSDYKHSDVKIKDSVLTEIEASAKKFRNTDKQVLLSFTGDPYCNLNTETKTTREVLLILLKYNIPVSILTKGGTRCLEDLDVFEKFNDRIKIGFTLTFDNEKQSLLNEPGAAVTHNRIEALKTLHKNGIKTWVSIEPVVLPEQSLHLMEMAMPYTDHFRIGKLNHYRNYEKGIDWTRFLDDSVKLMRKHDKPFYIKNDLFQFKNGTVISENERNMDYLNVK